MAKRERQCNFADMYAEEHLRKINEISDFLPKLKAMIPWETFRPTLARVREKQAQTGLGAPAYDVLLMFKILILQTVYNLSDDQTELQIRDRFSFRDFLDLSIADRVPDAKTVWFFREQLTKLGLDAQLFDLFFTILDDAGVRLSKGRIIDSTFVEVPRRHNTRQENATLKKGEIPETFTENPHRAAQKDCDATWTKKRNERHFGYKDHAVTDVENKLIVSYAVTSASVHDSQVLMDLMPEIPPEIVDGGEVKPDVSLYGDSAYIGTDSGKALRDRGYDPQFNERAYRGHPLTDGQKASNRVKSKTRSRVEHVFGAMGSRCDTLIHRKIGFARAKVGIGLRNLAYNLCRLLTLLTPKPPRLPRRPRLPAQG